MTAIKQRVTSILITSHRGIRVSRNKKRRINLWNENPKCYWCGIITVNPIPRKLHDGRLKSPKYMSSNTATLDHLTSRLSDKRGSVEIRHETVLACKACNEKRGLEESNGLGIEELRKRAKRPK